MLENLTEKEARGKILELVSEYYTNFHEKKGEY